MATIYEINRGINRSIEFRGIKAQYILYLAGGMVGLLLLFAVAFIIGINIYICVGSVFVAAFFLLSAVQPYSKQYGEHGLIKKAAQARMPSYITISSRNIFIHLNEDDHEED